MGVLDMINNDLVLRARLVVYSILIFFSFFIFVGTAVMRDKTPVEKCPLYLDKDGWGPESNCNYPIAISIMFQLLFLLYRVVTLVLLFLGKFTTDMVFFSDMMEFAYVVVDLCAFFLIFIAACILSAGTNSTCDSIDCEHNAFFKDAYSASKAAQAGAWISTFAWLFIGILGFLHLWRTGRIPFLGGAKATSADAGATGPSDGGAPPMETPPNNPDDMPKY